MRLPALVVLGLVAGAAACRDAPETRASSAEAEASGPLPMALHGMPLVEVTAGPQAGAVLRRLHHADVVTVESYVGRYQGGGASATLYLSRLGDAATADSLLERMAAGIRDGEGSFGHHTRFAVGSLPVHVVLGPEGRVHFFYARGPEVTWLAIDPAMARVGLADRLGVTLDRLPERVVLGGTEALPSPDSLYPHPMPDTNPPTQR